MPLFPDLGPGLGLRPEHYREVLKGRSSARWFEALTENYLKDGGRPLAILEKVRKDYPVALHGVSLNVGSAAPLDRPYLKRLKALVDRIEPWAVSDHCCWTGAGKRNLHDLLPLPYTREAVRHVADRIARVQEFLGRRMLIENLSSYLTFRSSEMTEWEFLSEIANRADCGILLDVNNVYVSAMNHGFDPLEYLRGIPTGRVGQIHLAGHSRNEDEAGRVYLVDTHDEPVCEEVWALYREACARLGRVSAMVERDARIPALHVLEEEIARIGSIREEFEITEKRNGLVFTRSAAEAALPGTY